jgi:enoyl-CoA hydratase
MAASTVRVDLDGPVAVVTIDRPAVRNAVDGATAAALVEAFAAFDADPALRVSVLTGAGGTFCAGADLKTLAAGEGPVVGAEGPSPMGPVRMRLGKPVLAAVEGHAVGGGLELALWCDLRIAAGDAVFGVFNRRFGVPLVDLGSVRLPQLIGLSRALDLILTGRAVGAEEAFAMGLVNRLVQPSYALEEALRLARALSELPQTALRNDRLAAYEGLGLPNEEAWRNELRRGLDTIASGETGRGAGRFAEGSGRHGEPL